MRTLGILPVLLASICFPAVAARGQATRPDATRLPGGSRRPQGDLPRARPKASEVTLTGDWMPTGAKEAMTKGDGGVWSVTLGPLPAGPDIYNFTIDGVAVPDPVNPRIKLRARTSASIVEVPGDGSELWQPADVPHGLVEIVWQKSEVLHGETRAFRVYTPPGYASDPAAPVPGALPAARLERHGGGLDGRRAGELHPRQPDRAEAGDADDRRHAVGPRRPVRRRARRRRRTRRCSGVPAAGRDPRGGAAVSGRGRAGRPRDRRAVDGRRAGDRDRAGEPRPLRRRSARSAPRCRRDFETRFKSLLDDPEGTNAKLAVVCDRLRPAGRAVPAVAEAVGRADGAHVRHTFHPTDGVHNYAVWRQYLGEIAPLLFRTTGKDGPPAGK